MPAEARTRITVHKAPPVTQVPVAIIPVFGVLFDMVRRTTCDPAVAVSTGPGDPGFDPKGPATGNFLIPAVYERCLAEPK